MQLCLSEIQLWWQLLLFVNISINTSFWGFTKSVVRHNGFGSADLKDISCESVVFYCPLFMQHCLLDLSKLNVIKYNWHKRRKSKCLTLVPSCLEMLDSVFWGLGSSVWWHFPCGHSYASLLVLILSYEESMSLFLFCICNIHSDCCHFIRYT